MLQQIGDSLKGHKWLTYTVFGALALIFAAWGAYGVANLSFGSSNYAAKVNGHTIPYEDVRAAWQREQNQWQQRFGGDIPAGERALLQDQLLESGGAQHADHRSRPRPGLSRAAGAADRGGACRTGVPAGWPVQRGGRQVAAGAGGYYPGPVRQ